ncbi:MAG: helix-turn-helix domain-containing protein [Cyanobacteriota bacterium]|nr:helix-turn-helix domain-containing protein [Cyanobacteriota bacterium]
MPPKVNLKPHLTVSELKARYRHVKDTTEARRWHLLYLIAQDWTIKEAAQVVDLNYDYAKQIVRRYNREGPDSAINRSKLRRTSSRSLLSPEQQAELALALQKPAPDGGRWSGPKVAEWIAKRTGRKRVWPQRGWDYLCRLKGTPKLKSSRK